MKLDFSSYLRADHALDLEAKIAAPLREVIASALGELGEIEQRLGEQDEERWRRVADDCFAGRGELRRAARVLEDRLVNHEERLAACESAHRKLRRALAAVLGGLASALDRSFPALATIDAEVETAVAVRRMYARFRRSLPVCDPSDPSSVRRALRYAAVSIAVMVGCDDFGDARASDRALIFALQERILRWARHGAADIEGIRIHADLVTTADLLRAINLRQELAAHDRRRLLEIARALAAADPAAALAAALPALHSLIGHADELDALIARARLEPATLELVAALRAAVAPPALEVIPGGLSSEPSFELFA